MGQKFTTGVGLDQGIKGISEEYEVVVGRGSRRFEG